METIEENVDDEKMNDLKDIRESQGIIDEVLVKTSDDVALMKKQKEENNHAIKLLVSKTEIIHKEIQKKGMEPNNSNKGNGRTDKCLICC